MNVTISHLDISDIIQITSIVISLLAIFISNYLGRKTEQDRFHLTYQNEKYYSYYFPIIKKLLLVEPQYHSYFYLVVMDRFPVLNYNHLLQQNEYGKNLSAEDWLQIHLFNNFKYISKPIAELYAEYDQCTLGTRDFLLLNSKREFNEKYFIDVLKADELFTKIIVEVLEESKALTKQLKLPDLTENILNNFQLRMEYTDLYRTEQLREQLIDLQVPAIMKDKRNH